MNLSNIALFIVAGMISFFCTMAVLRMASYIGFTSTPNARSSHAVPTPHAGGIAIVVAFLSLISFFFDKELSVVVILLFVILAGAVSLIGLWDDVKPIASKWRLFAFFIITIIAVALLGDFPVVRFGGMAVELGWIGIVCAGIALLWWLNLFNFMDGIDGIAVIETLSLCLSALLLLSFVNTSPDFTILSLEAIESILWLLVASVTGFLVFNWAPAKIFMGDVGSTFLGYTTGILFLVTIYQEMLSPWVWFVLGGVFWVDATLTLIRRVLTGQQFWMAHRSHAYQYAASRISLIASGGEKYSAVQARTIAHRKICYGVLAINVLWLLPMAYYVHLYPEYAIYLVVVAWLPLVSLAIYLGAGKEHSGNE